LTHAAPTRFGADTVKSNATQLAKQRYILGFERWGINAEKDLRAWWRKKFFFL
jgi:hypothetical protein